jgi:hypothetical protein
MLQIRRKYYIYYKLGESTTYIEKEQKPAHVLKESRTLQILEE